MNIIFFYLDYHSVGYLTMQLYVFGRLLSFKHIKMHRFCILMCILQIHKFQRDLISVSEFLTSLHIHTQIMSDALIG